MVTLDIIVSAIKSKSKLEIVYGGYRRLVEPHAVGVTKKGEEAVRCWQVAGGSSSQTEEGWKLFSLHKMSSAVSVGTFGRPREGYSRGDAHFTTVIEEV